MTDVPTWEMRPRCLVIVPGLSFDEFATEVWAPVRATHSSSNFWMADAMIYASDTFGEKASQLFDERLTDALLGSIMWVARCIPPARRRDDCSWTMHRLVAGLFSGKKRGQPRIFPAACLDRKAELQDELLARAAREGWHTGSMAAEIKRIEQEALGQPGHNLPPQEPEHHIGDLNEMVAEPQSITRVMEPAPEAGDENGAPEPAQHDEPLPGPEAGADAVVASPGEPDAPVDAVDDESLEVIELRRCIEAVRALAPALAAETCGASLVTNSRTLGREIFAALGIEPSAWCPLLSVEAAQRLIGADWCIRKGRDPGATIGEMVWTVELRWGHGMEARIAIGIGPHEPSAIVEAVLAAAIGARS